MIEIKRFFFWFSLIFNFGVFFLVLVMLDVGIQGSGVGFFEFRSLFFFCIFREFIWFLSFLSIILVRYIKRIFLVFSFVGEIWLSWVFFEIGFLFFLVNMIKQLILWLWILDIKISYCFISGFVKGIDIKLSFIFFDQ